MPPDVEAKLHEGAANHDAEAVRSLLTDAVARIVDATVDALLQNPSFEEVRRADGLTDREFEALVDELVNLPPVMPTLPEAALRREGVYENHA